MTMSSDPNKLEKEHVAKLAAHQREQDLLQRKVKMKEALTGISDDDRRYLLYEVLRELNSGVELQPLKPKGTS
jgi:uncharacterized protein with von Willebrand factor type A (vWA) domain